MQDATALAAIRDALDRAGMKPGVDVDVTLKPFQQVFEAMEFGGSRSEFRGESEPEPQRELEAIDSDETAIDVEIVSDDEDNWPIPEAQPEPERGSAFDSGPSPFAPKTPPPEAGLMSYEAAVSAASAMRRNAVSRRAQLALPRGSWRNALRHNGVRISRSHRIAA